MGCAASNADVDRTPVHLHLDFQHPETSDDEERKLTEAVAERLEEAPAHLEILRNYNGCEAPIREALLDPDHKKETMAWKAVLGAVEQLFGFYKFATSIEKIWPEIINSLCTEEPTGIQTRLVLAKQFAEIFDFVFHFDELKMVIPAVQNDFSYYRRVLGRMKNSDGKELLVEEELAGKMSFFFAYPTPMMKVLIDATRDFDKNAKLRLIQGFSLIANLSLKELEIDDGSKEKVTMLFLCAMTGCIILVDHLHDEGAFHKKSPIRIRACIQKLKEQQPSVDFLINSLRFTTLHLNDEQAMPAITKMLST